MSNAGLNGKILRFLLPVLAIIGIAISLELTYVYYNANFVPGSAPSFCAINSTIDCDAVARTEFSTFLGIPLSVYGLFFYIWVLKVTLIPYFNLPFLKDFKNPKSYIFSAASISVIVSVILGFISSNLIHKICILCYVSYLVNIAILLVSKSGASFMSHYENTVKDGINILSKPFWLIAVIIFTLLASAGLYYSNTSKIFMPKNEGINLANNVSPGGTKSYSGNILGSKNPKLIIHEYTDFECPYCSISNMMLHRLVSEVPDVQVVHHDFPLGGACNPKVNNPAHKNSCLAALYARAAEKQGKKWALIDLLFENQQDLSEEKILKLAKELNLNMEQLKKDAHNPLAKKQLKADINRAINTGIEATPSYLIGIKKHEGLMPYPELKEMALKYTK
ncbi:MAG: hypothetical protein A2287_03470 [Candidatus Melainabacteria bacterium RIFOXYA12_FULL_32_12]|nr:MAG: hypothetical protein A2287_03470 [Candidatus Melainabacteria bacterium RIFOXYA12_FULL_32_12]